MQYITVVKVLNSEEILSVHLFDKQDGYKPIEESKDVAIGLCNHLSCDVEFTIYNPTLNSGSLTRVFHGVVTVPEIVELLGKRYSMRRTQ